MDDQRTLLGLLRRMLANPYQRIDHMIKRIVVIVQHDQTFQIDLFFIDQNVFQYFNLFLICVFHTNKYLPTETRLAKLKKLDHFVTSLA